MKDQIVIGLLEAIVNWDSSEGEKHKKVITNTIFYSVINCEALGTHGSSCLCKCYC